MSIERTETDRRTDRRLRVLFGEYTVALDEDGLCELSVNPDRSVYAAFQGQPGMVYIGDMDAHRIEGFICAVAAAKDYVIDRKNDATLSCELPRERPWRGARFQGALPPASESATFTIRIHAREVFSLQDYVNRGIMFAVYRDAIVDSIRSGESILVAGGTFAGKTTLLNAIIAEMEEIRPQARKVIVEDTNELQHSARNTTRLFVHGAVDMIRVIKDAMRQRPDELIIGEVRDHAAAALIRSLNSGHSGGKCSIHADSATGALHTLESYISQGSIKVTRAEIARAIDLIVVIIHDEKLPQQRLVTEVVMVSDKLTDSGEFRLTEVA